MLRPEVKLVAAVSGHYVHYQSAQVAAFRKCTRIALFDFGGGAEDVNDHVPPLTGPREEIQRKWSLAMHLSRI